MRSLVRLRCPVPAQTVQTTFVLTLFCPYTKPNNTKFSRAHCPTNLSVSRYNQHDTKLPCLQAGDLQCSRPRRWPAPSPACRATTRPPPVCSAPPSRPGPTTAPPSRRTWARRRRSSPSSQGSNINMKLRLAVVFCRKLRNNLQSPLMLIVGPQILTPPRPPRPAAPPAPPPQPRPAPSGCRRAPSTSPERLRTRR